MRAWNEDMQLDISSLHTLPIWVQLPDLELRYWGMDSLSKLGSLLGIPIKTDRVTKEKSAVQYARLLIEMSIEAPFPDYIEFINDKEVVERQAVKCEWKPVKCQHCKMLGHDDMVCRKKKRVRQE